MPFGRKSDPPPGFYASAPAPAAPAPHVSSVQHNLEVRVSALQEKIKKCDEELVRQKVELGKHRKDSPQYNMAKMRASRMLKQKRMLEMQMDGTFKQQMNIDAVSMAVEQMQDAKSTVSIMEATNKQLTKELGKFDLDKAENLQDGLEELLNETNYISETLGRDYTVDGVNEQDLEAELDGIEEELFLNNANEVPVNQVIPGHMAPAQDMSTSNISADMVAPYSRTQ